MKDPAFLFYSSDFLSGTMLMSDEDIGQYIKLLCLQHQKGHLKEKDILNICKTYKEEIFSKFKKDEEGNYYNERLEEEVVRRKKYSESRRNNRNKCNNSNTCVYLIKNLDTGLTKIGSSNNPERRIIELKNQLNTENLKILAFVENVEQKIETELHNIYSNKNRINEWFELDEKDISNIICNYHMKNHMTQHMETETVTITENINKDNIDFYNNNINLMTPYELTILEGYVNEYGNDMLLYAMQLSVKRNKKNVSYIEGIFKNWKKAGIKTLIEAKQENTNQNTTAEEEFLNDES